MKTRLLTLLLILTALFGCTKEDLITVTEPKDFYQLPQGNNAFDNDILTIYQEYNSYLLYKFNPQVDFAWTQTSLNPDQVFGSEFSCEQADEETIGKVLAFIKRNWLSFYPDTFLKRTLPLKILMAKNLKRIKISAGTNRPLISTGTTLGPINAVTGFNHVTISNFSDSFDEMTVLQKTNFKSDIHVEYWNYMFGKNRLAIPPGFSGLSNYTLTVTASTMYANGFIDTFAKAQANPIVYDLRSYIKAITSNSKATLDNTILKSTNDTKGLIKSKYNLIIDFYKNRYNIDLQAIGDATLIL